MGYRERVGEIAWSLCGTLQLIHYIVIVPVRKTSSCKLEHLHISIALFIVCICFYMSITRIVVFLHAYDDSNWTCAASIHKLLTHTYAHSTSANYWKKGTGVVYLMSNAFILHIIEHIIEGCLNIWDWKTTEFIDVLFDIKRRISTLLWIIT